MIIVKRVTGLLSEKVLAIPLQALPPQAARRPAAAATTPGPRVLPEGRWVVKWESPLPEKAGPSALHLAPDRIYVDGDHAQLFDRSGNAVSAPFDGGGAVVDGDEALLIGDQGQVVQRSLATGAQLFYTRPFLSGSLFNTWLSRSKDSILLAGREVKNDPEAAKTEPRAVLEKIAIVAPLAVDSYGLLLSGVSTSLVFSLEGLTVASDEGRVLVAVDGALLAFDRALAVQEGWNTGVEPVGLTIGANSLTYLTVRKSGRLFVWVLGADATRLAESPLPEAISALEGPVVVAGDGRFFVRAQGRLHAFDADGTPRWEHKSRDGKVVRSAVASDGTVFVAEGDALVAFDREGQGREVLRRAGFEMRTTPVVTEGGELLIASATMLHCWETVTAREARLAREAAERH